MKSFIFVLLLLIIRVAPLLALAPESVAQLRPSDLLGAMLSSNLDKENEAEKDKPLSPSSSSSGDHDGVMTRSQELAVDTSWIDTPPQDRYQGIAFVLYPKGNLYPDEASSDAAAWKTYLSILIEAQNAIKAYPWLPLRERQNLYHWAMDHFEDKNIKTTLKTFATQYTDKEVKPIWVNILKQLGVLEFGENAISCPLYDAYLDKDKDGDKGNARMAELVQQNALLLRDSLGKDELAHLGVAYLLVYYEVYDLVHPWCVLAWDGVEDVVYGEPLAKKDEAIISAIELMNAAAGHLSLNSQTGLWKWFAQQAEEINNKKAETEKTAWTSALIERLQTIILHLQDEERSFLASTSEGDEVDWAIYDKRIQGFFAKQLSQALVEPKAKLDWKTFKTPASTRRTPRAQRISREEDLRPVAKTLFADPVWVKTMKSHLGEDKYEVMSQGIFKNQDYENQQELADNIFTEAVKIGELLSKETYATFYQWVVEELWQKPEHRAVAIACLASLKETLPSGDSYAWDTTRELAHSA